MIEMKRQQHMIATKQFTFSKFLRAYWADQSIIDGTWAPPPVVKVK